MEEQFASHFAQSRKLYTLLLKASFLHHKITCLLLFFKPYSKALQGQQISALHLESWLFGTNHNASRNCCLHNRKIQTAAIIGSSKFLILFLDATRKLVAPSLSQYPKPTLRRNPIAKRSFLPCPVLANIECAQCTWLAHLVPF